MIVRENRRHSEEEARRSRKAMDHPSRAFIAGLPRAGAPLGHAGANIAGGKGTAAEKMAALEYAGFMSLNRRQSWRRDDEALGVSVGF